MKIKKKSLKKQLDNIKKANYNATQLIEHLKEKYTFKTIEEKQLNILIDHLINMNILFSEIEKVIK